MFSPVIELASLYQIGLYTDTLYPKLHDFENGLWIDLPDVLPKSIETVLEVEGYEIPDNFESLDVDLWLGFDGAGSFRQFLFKDYSIDTKNMIQGWMIVFDFTNF